MGVEVAVIIGGAGGLGRLITLRLAERSCVSSSPTPTGPPPPVSSTSSAVVAAGQSSWKPTPRTGGPRAADAAGGRPRDPARSGEQRGRVASRAAVSGGQGVAKHRPEPGHADADYATRRSLDHQTPAAASSTCPPAPASIPSHTAHLIRRCQAGLIRFTSCVADWADRYRSGQLRHPALDLPRRARREFEQLTDQEKRERGGLVDPDLSPTPSSPSPSTVHRSAAQSSSEPISTPTTSTPYPSISTNASHPTEGPSYAFPLQHCSRTDRERRELVGLANAVACRSRAPALLRGPVDHTLRPACSRHGTAAEVAGVGRRCATGTRVLVPSGLPTSHGVDQDGHDGR